MKDFFFKEGSWWIYKNDSVNETDSSCLASIYRYQYTRYFGLNQFMIYDIREMIYVDNRLPGVNGSFFDCILENRMLRNFVPAHLWTVEQDLFCLDTAFHHLDSMVVNNKTYYDVQKCVIDSNVFYTARRIGLIRTIVYDSTHTRSTWDLIRYHISFEDTE
ncbi:MAG: hypothetical protein NTY96_00600 [Bacteroidetes bacterium]|nr:hypothetical protein [Bacteroidota bacterium]